MCGIIAIIGPNAVTQIAKLPDLLNHRGPDGQGIYADHHGVLYHNRLAIVDLPTGRQPLGAGQTRLIHNGEIYNHELLRREKLNLCDFQTQSDSEVILHLYRQYGAQATLQWLDGIFSFVILDGDNFMAARDPIGVKPLYYGEDRAGNQVFASEIKAIAAFCPTFKEFPAGHYFTPQQGLQRYFDAQDFNPSSSTGPDVDHQLRQLLTHAVDKQLMADVPVGCLLSGGLDSSLIAAIIRQLRPQETLYTFSVGIHADAPDLKAARQVAAHIGSEHHEVIFDLNQVKKDLKQILWRLESYDLANVRSGIPLYYLCQAIAEKGIKVVLSGEGADEIFGGYLFFNDAPSDSAFHQELINKLNGLATIDCLRVDRMSMAHGVEVRVPFLDRDVIRWAMTLAPAFKRPHNNPKNIEKYILRKAFDYLEYTYLPESILWRQKEQFSDGVGYSWREQFVALCEAQALGNLTEGTANPNAVNPPATQEARWIRQLFDQLFPWQSAAECVTCWRPAWQNSTDPSARKTTHHLKPLSQ